MIIKNKQGNDILKGGETRIAFAVNTEGCNDSGFAGMISRSYWPELAHIGECKLGTVLTKTSDDGIMKFSISEENELIRNFELENDTYVDPVKQIENEKYEKDLDFEL